MAEINKVDNVAKASIAEINGVPVANIEAVNNTPWTAVPQPLVMEIDSALLTANAMTLSLPSTGSYDFDVDWGDGTAIKTVTAYNDANASHTYATAQKYTITLQPNTPTGITKYLWSLNTVIRLAYTQIISFGSVYVEMRDLFDTCQNINWNTATAGIPNFLQTDDCFRAFKNCDSLTADLSSWGPFSGNTSQIFFLSNGGTSPNLNFPYDSNGAGSPTLSLAFASSNYNSPLSNWDVSNISIMQDCFSNAQLFNQDLGMWDVSSCTNAQNMFSGCVDFNQNLPNWNTANMTRTDGMFRNCLDFNGTLTNWTLPNVTTMQAMFQGCTVFNQPVNQFGITTTTTNLAFTFYNARAFDQNVNLWDVSGVTTFYRTFRGATAFRGGQISGWNVSNGTVFRGMFRSNTNFNENVSSWNVSLGTNFSYMFYDCPLANTDLRLWDVRNGLTFNNMFMNSPNMSFDISLWQLYSATNLNSFANNGSGSFTDQQCEDAFVTWSNDVATATNVSATLIWGNRTYPIGGAMQTATNKLTSATYSWTITGLTFV